MRRHLARHHRKLGWPEVWLVGFVALAIAPATIWWQQQYKQDWTSTSGRIISSELARGNSSEGDNRTNAKISYEYSVGMVKYVSHYNGYWPDFGSPNALAPSEVETLNEPGKKLVVYYDVNNQSRSTLHPRSGKASPFWLVLAAVGLSMAGAYTFFVYPAWRA